MEEEESFEEYLESLVEEIVRTGSLEALHNFVKLQAGYKTARLRIKALIFRKIVDLINEEKIVDELGKVFRQGKVFEFFDNRELFEMVKNTVKSKYKLANVLTEFRQYELAEEVIKELDKDEKISLARKVILKKHKPMNVIMPEIVEVLNKEIDNFLSYNNKDFIRNIFDIRSWIIEYVEQYSIQNLIPSYKYLIKRIADMLNNNELNHLHVSRLKDFIRLVQSHGYEVNGLSHEVIMRIAEYDRG